MSDQLVHDGTTLEAEKFVIHPTQKPKYNRSMVKAFLPYSDMLKSVYGINLSAKKYSA
jgi:hypothetical protein